MTKHAQNAKLKIGNVSPRPTYDQRTLDHAIDDVAAMRQVLADLTDDVLNELVRRRQHASVADGYPTGSSNDGTSGGDVSRPAETAGIARLQPRTDTTRATIDELLAGLAEAHGVLAGVQVRKNLVLGLEPAPPGSRGGYCQACGRWVPNSSTDRLRSGMCNADRMAFARDPDAPGGASSQPDMAAWKRHRLATMPPESKAARS